MDEPTPPPQKLPPWVKKEILLPVLGVFLVGSIFGNYLVYRAIKKEGKLDATRYGPMDRRPLPATTPLSQVVVDTGREFIETNGIVGIKAIGFTRLTGAWKAVKDGDREVMRLAGPDSRMSSGRPMSLSYRIHFNTPGRYRLRGLMRSGGAVNADSVSVYWNQQPGGDHSPDFELKVDATRYLWSAAFKDVPSPSPDTAQPKNRDFAENGFPVSVAGTYTLYVATVAEPVSSDHTPDRATDFIAVDRFELRNIELGDAPPD